MRNGEPVLRWCPPKRVHGTQLRFGRHVRTISIARLPYKRTKNKKLSKPKRNFTLTVLFRRSKSQEKQPFWKKRSSLASFRGSDQYDNEIYISRYISAVFLHWRQAPKSTKKNRGPGLVEPKTKLAKCNVHSKRYRRDNRQRTRSRAHQNSPMCSASRRRFGKKEKASSAERARPVRLTKPSAIGGIVGRESFGVSEFVSKSPTAVARDVLDGSPLTP